MSSSSESNPVHIVLVGDSIFDNAVYVLPSRGKSVLDHLNEKIEKQSKEINAKCTLVAKDGDVVDDVTNNQIKNIPLDTTHIFVSVGGNDALRAQYILMESVKTIGESLLVMAKIQEEFKERYKKMLVKLLAFKVPLTLCLIYNPNYEKEEQLVASVGLTMYNDVILSLAVKHQLPIIDLKTMFNHKGDYANPIEPSERGGDKITNAILNVLKHHNFELRATQIYV